MFFSQQTAPAGDVVYLAVKNTAGAYELRFTMQNGATEIRSAYDITPVINTWYHFAVVRNGNNWVVYLDGIQQGTTSNSVSYKDYDTILYIGAYSNSGNPAISGFLDGYIDELRISKGIAHWTSNFTPPSSPYGKVATVTSQKKFGTASGEFHGSGDYLSLSNSSDFDFGSGDFTIDFWHYTSQSNGSDFINKGGYGSAGQWWIYKDANNRLYFGEGAWDIQLSDPDTAPLNQWVHVAVESGKYVSLICKWSA